MLLFREIFQKNIKGFLCFQQILCIFKSFCLFLGAQTVQVYISSPGLLILLKQIRLATLFSCFFFSTHHVTRFMRLVRFTTICPGFGYRLNSKFNQVKARKAVILSHNSNPELQYPWFAYDIYENIFKTFLRDLARGWELRQSGCLHCLLLSLHSPTPFP